MRFGNEDQIHQGELEALRRRVQRATQLRLLPKSKLISLHRRLAGHDSYPTVREDLVSAILRFEEGGDGELRFT